jgi:hypothetical protein
MNDDLPCGWPFEQQAIHYERTLESIIDSMGLRDILLLLEGICYAKAQRSKDQALRREWTMAGYKLGQWARLINIY